MTEDRNEQDQAPRPQPRHRREERRGGWPRRTALLAIGLLVVLDGVLFAVAIARNSHHEDQPAGQSQAAASRSRSGGGSATPSLQPSSASGPSGAPLSLHLPTPEVTAFQPVPVTGRYPGATPGTRLVVERRSGDQWVAFPVPSATQAQGRFETVVELGEPGSYELRVRDPANGAESPVVVLKVE